MRSGSPVQKSASVEPDNSQLPAQGTTTEFGFFPIPRHLVYDPAKPPHFGLLLNILFGVASTFTLANLYYCQPLLIQLAQSFDVSYSMVSRIPTLIQAGFAPSVLLIVPIGDLVRRRQLILILVALSASLSVGLALTKSLLVFEILSFLVGSVSVTPHILIPLAADLARPERRASAISVVISGLLLGILLARILAGVVAEYTSWRAVYYLATAVQFLLLIGSYLMIPDYPAKNSNETYGSILWTTAKFAVTEPLLIQNWLINLASTAGFSCFWVTLTFLLGGPPYNYSTLAIGLFGLVGVIGVIIGPPIGRLLDNLLPWYATLISILSMACFQSIQVGAGGISIGAVIVTCIGLDIFRQMSQLALALAIFSISAAARARLSAIFVLSFPVGQLLGTAAGTKIHIDYGWRASAAFALGTSAIQLVLLFARGPNCTRHTWFGYEGGWDRRHAAEANRKKEVNTEQTPPLNASDCAPVVA